MQYTFSKSHRAKLSDFKTVFTFPVHAVDTKLELLINLVGVAPGPLVPQSNIVVKLSWPFSPRRVI